MNSFTSVSDLKSHADQTVTIRGWLLGSRSSGKIVFLQVRDGTGVVQCIVEAQTPDAFAFAQSLTQESSLTLEGRVRLDERAPGGAEILVLNLTPVQIAEEYPIARKEHGIDFLMNHRHLWLRSPRQVALLRIRHTIVRAVRSFFDDRGFTLIDTPIFQPGAAEGAGTLFSVDYFGSPAYLAQTGQLYVESACMALGKVYCFGPTFRAEKSKTRRHLTEFWMVEPEVAFADLNDVVSLAEAFVTYLVQAVLAERREELRLLGRDPALLEAVAPPFPRMTYSEVVDLLRSPATRERWLAEMETDRKKLEELEARVADLEKQAAQPMKKWKQEKLDIELREAREACDNLTRDLEFRPSRIDGASRFEWGQDLGGDEETLISRMYDKPLFVTRYPREAKAFYMKQDPEDPRVVLNLDLLAPEGYGEIIGGSQREDRLEALLERMKAEGMDPEPYQWYLDLRRYGSVPHGGFGLGIERTVAWICGLNHVRETIPFARLLGRMSP
ncbi:MAG: asparagine--tRNA ligase [Kiritimatiellia bacterium]|nr:asparagine--tRNA ligase [Kiritimatiellia bacterium]